MKYIVVLKCAGHRFCSIPMEHAAAKELLADFRARNRNVPPAATFIEECK